MLKLPDNVYIKIKTNENGKMDMVYEETYDISDPDYLKILLKNTENMLKGTENENRRYEFTENGVRLIQTDTERGKLGDYLFYEFLGWSDFADLTVRELLFRSAVESLIGSKSDPVAMFCPVCQEIIPYENLFKGFCPKCGYGKKEFKGDNCDYGELCNNKK